MTFPIREGGGGESGGGGCGGGDGGGVGGVVVGWWSVTFILEESRDHQGPLLGQPKTMAIYEQSRRNYIFRKALTHEKHNMGFRLSPMMEFTNCLESILQSLSETA